MALQPALPSEKVQKFGGQQKALASSGAPPGDEVEQNKTEENHAKARSPDFWTVPDLQIMLEREGTPKEIAQGYFDYRTDTPSLGGIWADSDGEVWGQKPRRNCADKAANEPIDKSTDHRSVEGDKETKEPVQEVAPKDTAPEGKASKEVGGWFKCFVFGLELIESTKLVINLYFELWMLLVLWQRNNLMMFVQYQHQKESLKPRWAKHDVPNWFPLGRWRPLLRDQLPWPP